MATLKSLLQAAIDYGSRNALPNPNTTTVDFQFSDGSGRFVAPDDGWVWVRAIYATSLFVTAPNTQNYIAGISGNVAFTLPVRKGGSVNVSWEGGSYSGVQCWGQFSPNN